MDIRLLRHYNRELQHLREMGAEFAAEFPKIAARLRIDDLEVSDPYVERLLEGFAFLAARVQLRLDAEFPRFTQRLLDILYPQFMAPVPSMLIAQVDPLLEDGALAAGVTLPRRTLEPVGFEDDHALLPVTLRGFAGYRLLQEYFALPQRFLFFDLRGVGGALRRLHAREAEIVILFSQGDAQLQQAVDKESV